MRPRTRRDGLRVGRNSAVLRCAPGHRPVHRRTFAARDSLALVGVGLGALAVCELGLLRQGWWVLHRGILLQQPLHDVHSTQGYEGRESSKWEYE